MLPCHAHGVALIDVEGAVNAYESPSIRLNMTSCFSFQTVGPLHSEMS